MTNTAHPWKCLACKHPLGGLPESAEFLPFDGYLLIMRCRNCGARIRVEFSLEPELARSDAA